MQFKRNSVPFRGCFGGTAWILRHLLKIRRRGRKLWYIYTPPGKVSYHQLSGFDELQPNASIDGTVPKLLVIFAAGTLPVSKWLVSMWLTGQMAIVNYRATSWYSVNADSGGSRISVRGMRRGSGPQFFRKEWPPISHGRLLPRISVARIFRGWVCPGVDPGFLVGDDGGAEGPERGAAWGLGRGAVAPPRYGVWGTAPRKFSKLNLQICAFWCIFAPV